MLGAVDLPISLQRGVDLLVAGHLARIKPAKLTRCLAFGLGMVFNAVFRHQARGEMRDACTQVITIGIARHGKVRIAGF